MAAPELSPALKSNVTLKTIMGICNEFKRYHYAWPTPAATIADFKEARMTGVNGTALHELLRTGGNGLARDPDFLGFHAKCLKLGWPHATLEALNPEVRNGLTPAETTDLVESIQFGWKSHPSDRVERPKESLWISLPHNVKLGGHDRAGIAYRDPKLGSEYAWVPITKTLVDTIEETGVIMPVTDANFYLELNDAGRLYARYQTLTQSRYLASFPPALLDTLRDKLAASITARAASVKVLRAPADLDAIAAPAGRSKKEDKPVASSTIAPEILAELQLLTASDNAILLPAQQLTQYAKIKALITTAGGKYVSRGAQFKFAAGFDAAAILETLQGGSISNDKKVNQFFATPPELAEEVVDDAGPCKNKRFLEPSAGDGALADIARARGAEVITIENWDVNVIKLKAKGYEPIQRDFLTVTPEEIGYFDAIIANPPFTKNQDIDHVLHMLNFLKPGGTLSTIMSTSWLRGSQKKQVAFREFLEQHGAEVTEVEAGAFAESGTSVPTARVVFPDYQPINRQGMAEEERETEEMEAPGM